MGRTWMQQRTPASLYMVPQTNDAPPQEKKATAANDLMIAPSVAALADKTCRCGSK